MGQPQGQSELTLNSGHVLRGCLFTNQMFCTENYATMSIALISYIHYLHFEASELYYIPTIACSKVLTCDSFVCSLTKLTSLTDL